MSKSSPVAYEVLFNLGEHNEVRALLTEERFQELQAALDHERADKIWFPIDQPGRTTIFVRLREARALTVRTIGPEGRVSKVGITAPNIGGFGPILPEFFGQ